MSFKITKKETENKTIRFPLELIDKIEKAIQGEDTTFSRFVILACEYALKNMKKKNPKKNNLGIYFSILLISLLIVLEASDLSSLNI